MATKEYGKRDPSSHRTPEQIHAMNHRYNHRPGIVKEREMRNEARAMMRRKLGVKAIEGKDIDHKTPVRERRTWWQQCGKPARTIASRTAAGKRSEARYLGGNGPYHFLRFHVEHQRFQRVLNRGEFHDGDGS